MNDSERIFLSPPHVGSSELEAIGKVFNCNYVAPAGPQLDAFEAAFAELHQQSSALALSSGTAALHLALIEAGVSQGDLVLTSTFSFVASANPILYCGATPVFIDSDERSWNMDPNLLREALAHYSSAGQRPKAVILAHIYGQSANLTQIVEICREFEVPLIEDAAEALGASWNGKPVGTFGEFGAFSFNGNKIITTGGGGMLVGQQSNSIEHARHLSRQARSLLPYYEHAETGYNYRMSNVLAAIGISQLKKLSSYVAARRRIFSTYQRLLGDLPGLSFMPELPGSDSTHWLSCIELDPDATPLTPEDLRLALEAENIESRRLWNPLHRQPLFKDAQCFGGTVAERLFARGLALPSGSALTEAQLQRISEILRLRYSVTQ